jgi:hypothetical protein
MRVTFGKSWFRAKKRVTETWTESQARKAHEQRQLYVALLGDDSIPTRIVEVNNDYVGVCFLDVSLREYLSYQFQELESGRMFLTMATHREFEGRAYAY